MVKKTKEQVYDLIVLKLASAKYDKDIRSTVQTFFRELFIVVYGEEPTSVEDGRWDELLHTKKDKGHYAAMNMVNNCLKKIEEKKEAG